LFGKEKIAMGLAISLGVLASGPGADAEGIEYFRDGFRQVNRVLAAHGLSPHTEPEWPPDFPYRGQLLGFPHSWLHYLRRAVAYARQAPEQFYPVPEGENPADDERIDRELSVYMDSHLICHSDCEGFYVPIEFPDPLYDDREGRLPGGILGSSQRALQEVIQAAPLLGVPVMGGNLSDDAAKALAQEPDGSHPYWIERQVWLTMFEAFRHSIEYQCAVVFG
jgi:hypothetical protein